jgi:putative membrane protein
MGFGHHFSSPWLGGAFSGSLFPVLIWGLIILLLVYLGAKLLSVIRDAQGRKNSDRTDSLEILKIRFAKGEIDQEEYARMKKILLN